jgi:hypothetical protein
MGDDLQRAINIIKKQSRPVAYASGDEACDVPQVIRIAYRLRFDADVVK